MPVILGRMEHKPAIEPMLMMCPALRALNSIGRIGSVHQKKGSKPCDGEPLMKSWVREIRPNTLTVNMASMSASEISPTFSTPSTNPALFTAC